MDQVPLASKRRPQGAQPTTRTPIRIARDKRQQQESHRRQSSAKIKTAKDSSEILRLTKRAENVDRPSLEDDGNVRHFTVANVGRNGTLYLKPSRMTPPHFTQAPATPPRTSDGPEHTRGDWGNGRDSTVSGTWTPHVNGARNASQGYAIPIPPPSTTNPRPRKQTRSRSFSTVDDSVRSPTYDSTDFQFLLNGRDASQRPRSSADLGAGFLDLRIPHYRLGTPRFSERGTAYLHNSMYSTSEGVRSSVFSRAEYDKLFPAPPGREHGLGFVYRDSTASPYLHPSHAALTPSRTPPTRNASVAGSLHPGVYGRIEANINDPTLVRYSSTTGQIIAATSARLIAQITSPVFLDYELLADFFLTFRSFMSCSELLEYLLARMQWALATDNDAGRIVRVRTFVALRHWILNYFADDFLSDLQFRQRFCNLVNELALDLRQRPDRGGTDIKVIGELKKCWRRTCATVWPVPDALDASPDSEILPGQAPATPAFGASATSLPISTQRKGSRPDLDFRQSSHIQLAVEPEKAGDMATPHHAEPVKEVQFQTASIPTSPMSEHSLTILSCSVPFLRHMVPTRENCFGARPAAPQRNPPLPEKPNKPSHAHKRSGSFSDALRDKRPPLPSTLPESVDLHSLPSMTFTGGLVRGLLLQPSPSNVNILIPLSPGMETESYMFGGLDSASFQDRPQNAGVKKIVGDVRRVLSSRKGRYESPASSHRSTNSSDSRLSGHMAQQERSAWQQLAGPSRVDRLGEKIEDSYREAFQDNTERVAAPVHGHDQPARPERSGQDSIGHHNVLPSSHLKRLDSHVTTGSRSIVIVDDTAAPEMPIINKALPSVSSWASGAGRKPLFRNAQEVFDDVEMHGCESTSGSPTAVASDVQQSISDPPIRDLPPIPQTLHAAGPTIANASEYNQARKSSNVNPPPIHHQLRRRPGGDLKAADHVHDLEPVLRDSHSTFSQAITSATASHDLSGTHFSGYYFNGLKLQDPYAQAQQKDSLELLPTHSSQPNMRPSFQKQVSHIAGLPDRAHDGGVEDALAKLEGKTLTPGRAGSFTAGGMEGFQFPFGANEHDPSASAQVVNIGFGEDVSTPVGDAHVDSQRTDRQGASIYQMSGSEDELQSLAATARQDADTHMLPNKTSSRDMTLQAVKANDRPRTPQTSKSKAQSTEDTISPSAFRKWDVEPVLTTPKGSFLLDDDESLSDISTEIGDQSADESLGVRSFFFDDTIDEEGLALGSFKAPPSPPSTVELAGPRSPERSPALLPSALEHRRPLKEASSAPKILPSSSRLDPELQQRQGALRRVKTTPAPERTAHLPFVLAFESDVIAEQLTIIEKDALDEVDWKDLIGLNWQQTPCTIRNWVDFLKKDTNGIDIVIGRFNLVVKWAVSECLLTETPSERAKCITKYIHVAAYCLRLRNYASMYQITLALLSSDLARLHQTWALVAPAERQTLARLEKLCQPLRNFHQLRSEMETASSESGCIPFIGLYTHDLMFNAQKPSTIDPPPPGKEKLINFERYQTAATIVKSLLRLIEASSNYIFRPHPEVLSRCLWLAALEDNDMTARSKTLEA